MLTLGVHVNLDKYVSVAYLQDPERAGGKDTRTDIGINCRGKIKK